MKCMATMMTTLFVFSFVEWDEHFFASQSALTRRESRSAHPIRHIVPFELNMCTSGLGELQDNDTKMVCPTKEMSSLPPHFFSRHLVSRCRFFLALLRSFSKLTPKFMRSSSTNHLISLMFCMTRLAALLPSVFPLRRSSASSAAIAC